MKEAEATAEAVEVAMEAAVAEPERLQTAEGAVNGALQGMALQATMCAHRCGYWHTRMRCTRGKRADGERACGGIVDHRRQGDGKPPGLIPGPCKNGLALA